MEKQFTYQQATEFLFNQLPMYQRIGHVAYKANLDNTLLLDEYFGHPHTRFKTIHVAGTNGKGSVSHMITSVLMEAGYKVGLYTSPHLKDFRERIRINHKMISEQDVIDFVQSHQPIIEKIKPSFFEMTVAMAFDYFARQQVDIAVIEVGLGGRLDSTNIITPVLSIITNIDFDHMQYLGNTLGQIAAEKAGIIKKNIPLVVGETHKETLPIFKTIAKDLNSQLIKAETNYQVTYSTQSILGQQLFQVYSNDHLVFPNLACDLLGIYQQKNICTVLTAIDQLNLSGFHIEKQAVYLGIAQTRKNTGLNGRWQILDNNPLIVCDIAHNPNGITQIVQQINHTPWENLHMVIGMVNDKDIDSTLSLMPHNATYYFTNAAIPRAMNASELMMRAMAFDLKGDSYPSVSEAIEAAKKKASPNDLIFIGGSTFVVAEAI